MNWTSAKVPLWEADCEEFRRAGRPFEVRHVDTEEAVKILERFATKYGLRYQRKANLYKFDESNWSG
jgi:hypothetical protein